MKFSIFALICGLFAAAAARTACNNVFLPGGGLYTATAVPVGTLKITQGSTTITGNKIGLCRVVGAIPYGPNGANTLNYELWLPNPASYNGRYVSVGNGGFAGSIDYWAMLDKLNRGYAVGGGDGGHTPADNGQSKPGTTVPFLHDTTKVATWLRDGIAMFSVPAKNLTTVYYGKAPTKNYYIGCSTGGGQGYALAQYHPEIFDGISASCPGNWYSHLMLSFLWNGVNSQRSGALLSQDALNFVTSAVLDACDTIDGVKDRLISDPAKCSFDVTKLACASGQAPSSNGKIVCLTCAQVTNVQQFYAGPKSNGKAVYPGFAFGSEAAWLDQESSLYLSYAVPLLQNLVYNNLSYDYKTFNWNTDVATVDKIASPAIDHISANLETFRKRGGKLISLQGWADPYNSPYWPIEHREQVRAVSGDALDSFYSLFMIPGGGHCGSSPPYPQIPAVHNLLDRLVTWVETGQVPQNLVGSQPADGSGATVTIKPYPRPT